MDKDSTEMESKTVKNKEDEIFEILKCMVKILNAMNDRLMGIEYKLGNIEDALDRFGFMV
jgi:hypothetical protein